MAQQRRNDTRRASEREPRRETQNKQRERRHSHHKKRAGAGFVALYIMGVIGASIILACLGWAAANDMLALNKEPKTVTVTISADDSFRDVTNMLKKEGLIEYKTLFKLFAALTNGKEKVTMGTYTLNTDMDYRALIAGMSVNSSTKAEITVTIPEGYNVTQVFKLLEEKGVSTMDNLSKEAAEHDYAFSFLQEIPLGDMGRLEGYLYPDTYTFYTPHSPLYAINKMLVNFDSRVDDDVRAEIEKSGRSMNEILTIASLIEKETDGKDRAKIASVIYNRLNNPKSETAGFLQIDATLAYINGGRVPMESDKGLDSPYNTYKNKGLPPGPICNPGMESIHAALNPEKTGYYYYALGDDEVHHFFKTYKEHQNFLASQKRYQK